MPDALFWLVLTAALGALLWIPWVAGFAMTHGFPTPRDYREVPPKESPSWVRRADRVLMNYVESVVPFAVLVLVADQWLRQNEPGAYATVAVWAQVFFWSRLGHAVVYWLGLPYVRTLAFLLGWIAIMVIFFQFL